MPLTSSAFCGAGSLQLRGLLNALGQIELLVTFEEGSTIRTEIITFDVVDVPYA